MEIFPFKVAVGPNGPQQYLLGLSEFFRQLLDTNDPPTSPSNEAPHIQAVSHHISNQWATTYSSNEPPSQTSNEPPHIQAMSHHISNQWTTTSPSNEPPHLKPMCHHISTIIELHFHLYSEYNTVLYICISLPHYTVQNTTSFPVIYYGV